MPPATAPSPEVFWELILEKAFTTTNSSGAHARRTPNQNRLFSIEPKLFLPDTELSPGDDSTRADSDAWPWCRGAGYESGLLLGRLSSASLTFVFALHCGRDRAGLRLQSPIPLSDPIAMRSPVGSSRSFPLRPRIGLLTQRSLISNCQLRA